MKDKLFNFRVSPEWLEERRNNMQLISPEEKSLSAYIMEMVELGEEFVRVTGARKESKNG